MGILMDKTDRIISSDIWPARYLILILVIFFWYCLKDKVYSSNPQTEEELKDNIHREISNIKYKYNISSEGKSKPLLPVRGMSACRGTTFSTPPMICEQR
jgi:hypothetical protein